jgi:response regulator RpfG family c-di-GMP phosphodiesterase
MTNTEQPLPRVLCVDDEAHVVQALLLHLRKDYDVSTALSGDEALETLKRMGGAAVVISDMRMPGMNGATLLNNVMQLYPDASRIMLTGETGRDAAVSAVNAVNHGHVLQFLTKPCTPEALKAAVAAGVAKHRLVNGERAILKETLNGCVEMFMEILALTNAAAFGRASRLNRLATEFAASLGYGDYWQLQAATQLSQLGYWSLPGELLEKIHGADKLTPQEAIASANAPHIAISLLKRVPRLEPVMEILTALDWTDEKVARLGDGTLGRCTRILGLVLDYDTLVTRGHSLEVALRTLRGRSVRFGADLIERFAVHVSAAQNVGELRVIALHSVTPGMIIMQDVRTQAGTLVVTPGLEVTDVFLQRAQTFDIELLNRSVRVLVRAKLHTPDE